MPASKSKRRKRAPVTPVPVERHSVISVGVPRGAKGEVLTQRAVRLLRQNGYGAGVLANDCSSDVVMAAANVIEQTRRAVAVEAAKQKQPEHERTEDQ